MVYAVGEGSEPIVVQIDTQKIRQERQRLGGVLRKHPQGYVVVIFKSSRNLYLARDGQVVENERVKKSSLDPEYAFLKGSSDDEMTVDFPIPVGLGHNPVGQRTRRFDKKTPEGEYFVCRKNARGETKYTVGLEISYPNLEDAKEARDKGRITQPQYDAIRKRLARRECPPYNTGLGGYIKIHGPDTRSMRKMKREKPETYRQYLRIEDPLYKMVTDEDWTFGCVAVEQVAAFYLYKVVPEGTPVIIFP